MTGGRKDAKLKRQFIPFPVSLRSSLVRISSFSLLSQSTPCLFPHSFPAKTSAERNFKSCTHTHKDAQTDTQTHRDMDTDTPIHKDTQTHTDTDTQRHRDTQTHTASEVDFFRRS